MTSRKKHRFLFMALTLTMLFSSFMSAPLAAASDEVVDRYFYSAAVPQDISDFVNNSLPQIAQVVSNDLGEQGLFLNEISVGMPFSLNAEENLFYFPLAYNSQIVYVLCVGRTEDPSSPFSLTYGKMFSDKLNSLNTSETYMVIENNNDLYAVSASDTKLLLDISYEPAVQGEAISLYNVTTESALSEPENINLDLGNINGIPIINTNDTFSSLAFPMTMVFGGSRTLNVPQVLNPANMGCYIAVSESIIRYFRGYSPYSPEQLHSLVHSGHPLYNCGGGDEYDIITLLNINGIYSSMNSPLQSRAVIDIIDRNIPICAIFSHLYRHATVLCGYYSTSTSITYYVMDPNIPYRQNIFVNFTPQDPVWGIPQEPTVYYNFNGDIGYWNSSVVPY